MSQNTKITVYVRNKDITPSSYYRIIQYLKEFEGEILIRNIAPTKLYQLQLNANFSLLKLLVGIIYYFTMLSRVTYYLINDVKNNPDIIIVSKAFCPRYTPGFLAQLIKKATDNSRLIWDFDDYIFTSGEISDRQANVLKENSNVIVVTNDYLKSKIESRFQNKVVVLPTTDGDFQGFNENDLIKKRKSSYNYEIRLVWIGTATNIHNLLRIADQMDDAAKVIYERHGKKLVLTVVSNKALVVDANFLNIINVNWSREKAKDAVFNSHIGIMPLINNEYSLGKGGFKLVQYISSGLPVIGSKVGYNEKIITDDCGILVNDSEDLLGWKDAIIEISKSKDKWEQMSRNAYLNWNLNFSYQSNVNKWKILLKHN